MKVETGESRGSHPRTREAAERQLHVHTYTHIKQTNRKRMKHRHVLRGPSQTYKG